MSRRKKGLLLLVLSFFVISACGPETLIIGGVVGSGAGTYYYIRGELITDYGAPIDQVWGACEKAVADMRGKEVEPKKVIGTGTIRAVINDENVQFKVNYKSKDLTSVGIRVGFFGNRLSAQLLHDRIRDNLAKR